MLVCHPPNTDSFHHTCVGNFCGRNTFFIPCNWITLTGRARLFTGMWTQHASLPAEQWARKEKLKIFPLLKTDLFFLATTHFAFCVGKTQRISSAKSFCGSWTTLFREPRHSKEGQKGHERNIDLIKRQEDQSIIWRGRCWRFKQLLWRDVSGPEEDYPAIMLSCSALLCLIKKRNNK